MAPMGTVSGGGTSSGGGGLVLRRPPDEFTGASLAACRTARDTYFMDVANAAALAEFQRNQSLAVVLKPAGASSVWEAYAPGQQGMAYDNTQWLERTDAVEGPPATDGVDGAQGRFTIYIHTNSAGQPVPRVPVGGEFDVGTNVLTPPAGTTEAPSAPNTGEDVWISQADIDPKTQSGRVTPVWSEWIERAHVSSGLTSVAHSSEFAGTGATGDPLTLDPAVTRDTEIANLIRQLAIAGFVLTVTRQDGSTSTLNIPDDVADVTGVGLPVLDENNYKRLFIDHDTPRVWVGHREQSPDTDAQGNWVAYAAANYLGDYSFPNFPSPITVGSYLYDTVRHFPVVGHQVNATDRNWLQASFTSAFGANAVWIGEQPDRTTAANLIENFDANNRYLFYNIGTGDVEVLTNATYVAPVTPRPTYSAEPISAPTGVGSLQGVTAGDGLVGGGTSGVVSLSLDVSLANFPTIPIAKGGTGASTAGEARTNLGLAGADIVTLINTALGSMTWQQGGGGMGMEDGVLTNVAFGNDGQVTFTVTGGTDFMTSMATAVNTLADARIAASALATQAALDAAVARIGTLEGAGYQTQANVQGLINAGGFQTAAMVTALITAANLASQADLTALTTRVTRLEGFHPSQSDHTRIMTWRMADNVFTAADFTGANASTSETDDLNGVDTADDAYPAFAYPATLADLTDIRQTGALFSSFGSFEKVAELEINGVAHKVYRATHTFVAGLVSGSWTLTGA